MKQNNEIWNELNDVSKTVAALPKRNVYATPANYFENIEQFVLSKIQAENDYDVPAGYFDNLHNTILQKVRANDVVEEIRKISTTVASISNKNVYKAPANYFEKLNHLPPSKAHVIPITRYFKMAVAAVIVGLLGFGIFTFVQHKNSIQVNTASVIHEANKIIKTESFDKDFAALTDKDLEQYLLQNGEDVNASMVASTTDEEELPDALEYSIDPSTLDNFLNENNLKN